MKYIIIPIIKDTIDMVYATLTVSFFILIIFLPLNINSRLNIDIDRGRVYLNIKINRISVPLVHIEIFDLKYMLGKRVAVIKISSKKNNPSLNISDIFHVLSAFCLKKLNIYIITDNKSNIDKKCILLGVTVTIIGIIKNTFQIKNCQCKSETGRYDRIYCSSEFKTNLLLIIIAITKILISKGRKVNVDNRPQRIA